MKRFIQRHAAAVIGTLSGFDRLRLRGTKRLISNLPGMFGFLCWRKILLKDFTEYAKSITDQIRRATERIAEASGHPIRYLVHSGESKEKLARQMVTERGIREGLIGILRCVEPCWSYKIVGNRRTRQIDLAIKWTKCLHYYHYYLHPLLGFMHVRLQTWFPFTVHICLNGREWLARQMDAAKMGYARRDNCFVYLDDPAAAQRLMDRQLSTDWKRLLDGLVPQFNPVDAEIFGQKHVPYYWSVEESEWASDVMFRSPSALAALYPRLIRHGVEHVGSREVMRFLGHKVPTTHAGVRRDFHGEVVTDLRERPEGMRIKHRLKRNWIKMYDKQGSVLRVETVINNPRDWKVYRPRQEDPGGAKVWLPLRKGVADLYRRTQVSQAANRRYLDTMAVVDSSVPLGDLVRPLCRPVQWKGQRVRALNPLSGDDVRLLEAVNRGEFAINGFRNRDLRVLLCGTTTGDAAQQRRQSAAITRKIRLLRAHKLILKVQKTHRYMLTVAGRHAIGALLAARAANPAKLIAAA